MIHNSLFRGMVAVAVSSLFAMTAHAGTLTNSATAPTTDSNDVFQAAFGGSIDGGRDYTDNGGAPGQIFRTTSTGGQLLSLTVKGAGNGSDYAIAGGLGDPIFTVRISTITGNTLTPLFTETASSAGLPGGSNSGGGTTNYITFTFATAQTLAANTNYAWELSSSNGYLPLSKVDVGTGGAFNSTSGQRQFNSNTVTFSGGSTGPDRTFYVNVSGAAAVVPESSTLALICASAASLAPLALRRLRRK